MYPKAQIHYSRMIEYKHLDLLACTMQPHPEERNIPQESKPSGKYTYTYIHIYIYTLENEHNALSYVDHVTPHPSHSPASQLIYTPPTCQMTYPSLGLGSIFPRG